MQITLIKIPVISVLSDSRFPDRDTITILDHLIRYCATFDPLPSISIVIEQGHAILVRGHKYMQAARALGRETILAEVEGNYSPEQLSDLMANTQATVIDWKALRAAEDRDTMPKGWQVIFFDRPLTAAEKTVFDTTIKSLFSHDEVQVRHDDKGPVAEFEARMPVTDEGFFRRYVNALARFHDEHVRIISLQGARFGGVQTPQKS